ncbi:MAG: hypothetical protein JWN01_855 [Patescibacteria group bacterium]|nr:hypothetical protein [Patescibacteria group bacterium]
MDVVLAVVVVVAVVGALGAQKGVRQQVGKTVTAALPSPVPPHMYKTGETATMGVYALTVKQTRVDAQGTRPYVPGAGYQYYVADVVLKNTGKEALEAAPAVQMYLRDATGANYAMAPAPLDVPFAAGQLVAGEERAGQVSFAAPQTAVGLRLIFDPAPAAGAVAVFEMASN